VGGAKGQPGTIYLHSGNGELVASKQLDLEDEAAYEDTAASFVDVDGDGDMDLLVGSGGNEKQDQKYYVTRLYLNNGKGKFDRSSHDLPTTNDNISVISPFDFDEDGDMDLFIGSRSVPAIYGINPSHLLLINDGTGIFTDGTERYAYDLRQAGMVTDAIWADIDGDGLSDLLTVSDWGSPKIFKNSGRGLRKQESSLDSLSGWWLTLEASDLDNDGDLDLILGNSGSNIPYQASKDKPVKLWVNDFDQNGDIEQIKTVHYNKGDYPIHMRKEITNQIVSLKKENLKASEYARKTIHELFSPEIMENTIELVVKHNESMILENNGDYQFTAKPLPNRVQLSCVCDITCEDINGDGITDLVMAGNNYEFKPQYSRLDSNYGSLLLGKGNLEYEWQNYNVSGFFIKAEVKKLMKFRDNKGRSFLMAALNDEKPKIFEIN
jgi:hypothetical protein